jgi:hypothetical protein
MWGGSAADVQQLQCQMFTLLLSCMKVAPVVHSDTLAAIVKVMGIVQMAEEAGRGVFAAASSSSSSNSTE